MNDFSDLHTPRPEFRHALEQRVVGTLQRETRYAPYYRIARNVRVRSALLIALGAALGVGCGYASAQVRESQVRSELMIAAQASLKLAALRMELANASLAEQRKRFDAKVITRSELLAAQAEVTAMEKSFQQARIEMEEIAASASTPRNELWAPLVNGRDFVKQRLELEAAAAQQRLTRLEDELKERERYFRMKVITSGELQSAQVELLQARHELEAIANRLALRQQFIEKRLDVESVSRQEKLQELHSVLAMVESQAKLAEQRAALVKERNAVGAASELDLKRAELELLELRSRLLILSLELKAYQGRREP